MTQANPPTDLANERREYDAGTLLEQDCPSSPFDLFDSWLTDALQSKLLDATAMTLATVDEHGQPSSRTVLLKEWDEHGLIFYTSYNSRKAHDLFSNSRAGVAFHWRETSRQILIEAQVSKISPEASAGYFSSRPRDSQLAVHATRAQGPVSNREAIDREFQRQEEDWKGQNVPMPPDWGGYRIVPHRFEFWQGRTSRLHDRMVYEQSGTHPWTRIRLFP